MLKIGISLYDGYKQYLEKLASDNHISITKVCSLICANFLSYNMFRGVYPRFQKFVKIVFDGNDTKDSNRVSESNSFDNCSTDRCKDSQWIVEKESSISYDEILSQLEDMDVPDDVIGPDDLPF